MEIGRILRVLALSLVAAGCGEKKHARSLDFAAYGDCRHGTATHRKICRSLSESGAKLVLVTGDLVDHPDQEDEWGLFHEITRDLRAKAAYYPAIGNHDADERGLFQKEFRIDRLHYDRREGDVHFFMLNSNSRFVDREQIVWLEKTASASSARHKIAVFHHPPFMIDQKRGFEAKDIRANIHGVLVRLKFCAAICGHQHAFYTTLRDGVRYVVTGGGGAPLWKLDPSLGIPGDLSRKLVHFVGFRMSGERITAGVYDSAGVEAEDLAFTLCEHPPPPP